jgi:UDP-N-acetylbacillosamine N-acetyltransferase
MRQKLVIWGASGHAMVVADIIRLQGEYELIGFIDDLNLDRYHTEFFGAYVLGGREQLDLLPKLGVKNLIFGFGDCSARLKLSDFIREKGFLLATAIHPRATIATDVSIGDGTVVAAGAVVNPGSKIGENVIINTCASIDHECMIGSGVHVCPDVHIGCNVIIGQGAWLGIGATVREKVAIGANTLIGAGAVVIETIPENVVAYGVPAKIIKKRDEA